MQEKIFEDTIDADFMPISKRPVDKHWYISFGKLMVENAPPVRRVYLYYQLISEYKIGDKENERLAIIYANINGAANQKQLAKIWGLHYNTVNNYIAAYNMHGFKGLTKEFYEPKSKRTTKEKVQSKAREPMEYYALIPKTEELGKADDQTDEEPDAIDTNTTEVNVESDLEEETVIETRYGGRMLYYPLINEMFDNILKKAESIEKDVSKKIFGLKQIIMTLLFYVLCGITNPERSKSIRRKEFGVLIGKTASPCCKTLRAVLDMLTVEGFPEYIMGELPRQYVRLGYVKLGIFYVDGHFVPYYGKKDLHKGYSTQRRIAMKGHYQNWVNDVKGRPIFFYVNNSFVKFTDAILNSIADAGKLMEDAGINERLIVVFDRGGFSGRFFAELDSMGIGFITWLKGKRPDKEEKDFDMALSYRNRKGETVEYRGYKEKIKIRNYNSLIEAITVYEEKTKKQSTFVNNLEHVGIFDKSDSYKIELLDGRWAQENFFKEAKVKADIDHQTGYQFAGETEGEDLDYEVANPEYVVMYEKLQSLTRKFERSEKAVSKVVSKYHKLKRKKVYPEYLAQKGNSKIINKNKQLKDGLEEVREDICGIPARVKYSSIREERKDILKTVRSAILLSIRAAGYNIMKRFEDLASECFKDHRELGKFVLSLLDTSAEIKISGNRMIVKLKPLETPVYQRAAKKLVSKMNDKGPITMDGKNRRIEFRF